MRSQAPFAAPRSRLTVPLFAGFAMLLAGSVVFAQDVFVNQSGYNLERPKRFTAPGAADGSPFVITAQGNATVLFNGTVAGEIGDFTGFAPAGAGPYVVAVNGNRTSYPFNVGKFWIERVSYQRAIDFMIDSRRGFGVITPPPDAALLGETNNGVAWRDADTFSFEISPLIQMFCSNPGAYTTARMPVQGDYTNLTVSLPPSTPEVVKLIYWGVDLYLRAGVDHTLMKEQLAYFLYYYPAFSEWIPYSEYERVRDYLFPIWGKASITRFKSSYDINHTADLFQTYTVFGSGKGAFPPGHSIVPNLLMYEVALREGWPTAAKPYTPGNYQTAAYNNAARLIANLDLTDPATTKGQRMSERILMEGLAYYQRMYPAQAPPGLLDKIRTWADIAIGRSNNLWDFRKYSDTVWIIPGYNEPGNVAGFPASAFAASQVLTHSAEDQARRAALERIAIAQIDNLFGRNPLNRHFCYDATSATAGFEGADRGWSTFYNGGLGALQNARGVLDGSPKEDAYPYNPAAGAGYTEGWVAFNAAWNQALAYMAADDLDLRITDAAFAQEMDVLTPGASYGVELRAPLNFNYNATETGEVIVTTTSGDRLKVTVTEVSSNHALLRGTFVLQSGTANTSSTQLEAVSGDTITAAYGFGVLGVSVAAAFNDTDFGVTTAQLPDGQENSAYGPTVLGTANAQGPVTWSIPSGALPAGVTLSAGGSLGGTPTAAGNFTFEVSASDGISVANRTLSLRVFADTIPQITTESYLPLAYQSVSYSTQLAASGGNGLVAWSLIAGALPDGLTVDAAGLITGVPEDAGIFDLRFRVQDADGDAHEKAVRLTVQAQLPLATLASYPMNDEIPKNGQAYNEASPSTDTYPGSASGNFLVFRNGGKDTGISAANDNAFAYLENVSVWPTSDAVAARVTGNHMEFTVNPSVPGEPINLKELRFEFHGAGYNVADGLVQVQSSVDGFGPESPVLAAFEDGAAGVPFVVDLSATRFQGLAAITFRFYFSQYPSQANNSRTLRLDEVVLTGSVGSVGSGGSFSAFQADNFAGGTAHPQAGPALNPDFDAFPNLLEYALHLDPNVSDPDQAGLDIAYGENGILGRFVRDANFADIAYVVEASPNLTGWTPVYDSRTDTAPNTHGEVMELDLTPAAAAQPQCFFRLRVIQLPR